MERGPLPPHERTWRHPSELAAEERELERARTAAPSTRVFALTTGTLGLLAVGVLILTVTPRRYDDPIAISATTTPVTVAAAASQPEATSGSDPARPAPLTEAFAVRGAVTTDLDTLRHALATPIGDGRLALITRDAANGHDTDFVEVRLPSGRLGQGQVIDRTGDTWLIELQQAEPGHDIASRLPSSSEIVMVMESPPITIALAELAELDIEEGTAVLDGDGDLIGICTHRHSDGKVRLIEVRSVLVDATTGDQ